MVIGDFLGYSAYGQGGVFTQRQAVQARPAVTLEAERDPQTPHQYRVAVKAQILPPAEPVSDSKSTGKKAQQNSDPASRVFYAVANYGPTYHRIDIEV